MRWNGGGFGSPGQTAWNLSMLVLTVLVVVDIVRTRPRGHRLWPLFWFAGTSVGVDGWSIPIGVLIYLGIYRWLRTPSGEVEHGADDLAGAHGGDGVVDLF